MSVEVLKIGRVVAVSGVKVVGALDGTTDNLYRTYKSRRYTVGQVGSIIKIEVGDKLVFGFVTALRMTEAPIDGMNNNRIAEPSSDPKWLEIELFGEALRTGLGEAEFDFQRGVVTYPLPGQNILVATVAELAGIYNRPDKPSICVGSLSQSSSLPAYLLVDELLGKHFAVLGTTGSGKSCSVTVLLRSILEIAPEAHMILLDPHNEYKPAFANQANIIDPTTLHLPHWLLNFEESVEVFIGRTEHAATSQTNILKDAILAARRDCSPDGIEKEKITVDTPVPYKLETLITNIKSSMPSASSRQDSYLKITNKIQTLLDDKRFSFLIHLDEEVKDELTDLVGRYLRIPVSDKPLSIIDLSGVPSDVVHVVVSMLCRIIFDFAVWSQRPVKVPIVLVCEEAHRYAPYREEAISQPTKGALARIAQEGRKYGVGLGLISQRPSELDPSVLSQCNTLIALRMSNQQDQNFVQRALPDSLHNLANMLPALRTQEALVVGEGTAVPMRLSFKDLPEANRPQSTDVAFVKCWNSGALPSNYVGSVIQRWRLQQRPTSETDQAEE